MKIKFFYYFDDKGVKIHTTSKLFAQIRANHYKTYSVYSE